MTLPNGFEDMPEQLQYYYQEDSDVVRFVYLSISPNQPAPSIVVHRRDGDKDLWQFDFSKFGWIYLKKELKEKPKRRPVLSGLSLHERLRRLQIQKGYSYLTFDFDMGELFKGTWRGTNEPGMYTIPISKAIANPSVLMGQKLAD
jgi:hypothetical protein